MGLSVVQPGVTTKQVAATIAGATTSARIWTQTTVLAGDTLTATTTAEQPYASSCTIPAGTLVVGQQLNFKGSGVYSTTALLPPTQRARLRVGGQVVVDSGALTFPVSLSALRYWFEIQMMVRAVGVNGGIEATGKLEFATSLTAAIAVIGGPSGVASDAGNPVTVDTTQALSVQLSCQFGGVLAANSNTMRQAWLHTLRPAVA